MLLPWHSKLQQWAFNDWLNSPPSSDSRLNAPRLLLDLFPPEIRTRIACLVSHGSQTAQLLALARTNSVQRSAVLSALRHRLVLPPVGLAHVLERWADVFSHDIKEIVCERGCFRDFQSGWESHFILLCQASTLRKVTLCDESDVLEAVKNSASIRDVKVHIQGQTETTLLLETLRSLDLKSLEIACDANLTDECPLQILLKLREAENTISGCCPRLRSLHLRCGTHFTEGGGSLADAVLWRNLPALRALEAVTVHDTPPDEMLPFLGGLRYVRVNDMRGMFYSSKLMRELASQLTEIRTTDCFTEQYSAGLEECVGLEELETNVARGSEIALGNSMKGMEGLRRLTLQWELSDGMVQAPNKEFVEAKDIVSLIVDKAKRLEELRLRRVRIPVGDVVSILRGVGGQLRELEVDVVRQDENPLEWLETLLMAVVVHCPSLRELSVTSQLLNWPQRLQRRRLGRKLRNCKEDSDWIQIEAQLRKVDAMLLLVGRRMPLLDVCDVKALHRAVEDILRAEQKE